VLGLRDMHIQTDDANATLLRKYKKSAISAPRKAFPNYDESLLQAFFLYSYCVYVDSVERVSTDRKNPL
jgi:hypothetical protein